MRLLSARLLLLLPCLVAPSLLTPAAHADGITISGVAYCNITDDDAQNTPAPGASVSGTECATFNANQLIFYSDGSGSNNTLGYFLTSQGSVVGDVTYLNGFSADSSLDNSFFQFSGTGYFVSGQTYNAYHDDGTVLNIGGSTVLNSPGVTSPVDTTFVYNATTGNFDYVYNYTEHTGGSVFATDADAPPIPEPMSLLLCGTGFLLLFSLRGRRNGGNAPHIYTQGG